jgi:hypothetical protein
MASKLRFHPVRVQLYSTPIWEGVKGAGWCDISSQIGKTGRAKDFK